MTTPAPIDEARRLVRELRGALAQAEDQADSRTAPRWADARSALQELEDRITLARVASEEP